MFKFGTGDKQELEGLSQAEQDYLKGRDLLSVMVKANADLEIPDDQRLPDADVTARKLKIVIFFVARVYSRSDTRDIQRSSRSWLLDTKRLRQSSSSLSRFLPD